MKTITAVLFVLGILVSGVALAGDYSQAVAREQYCGSAGKISGLAYRDHNNGISKEETLDRVSRAHKKAGGSIDKHDMFAINYAYDQATSVEDAYMTTWAWCMDHITEK